MSHGGPSRAAVVHGFTTAFAVGVGIMATAAVVVVTLVRPQDRGPAAGEGVYDAEPGLDPVPVPA